MPLKIACWTIIGASVCNNSSLPEDHKSLWSSQILWLHYRTIKQLHLAPLSCMWRPEPMLARSHTMPARGSFWPLWSDRRLYKVTMHWLHKFEANPADHQAVMWFFALGPPGWRRQVRSSPPPLSFTLSANHSPPATPMRSKNSCWPEKAQNP